MIHIPVNASSAPAPAPGYAQAALVGEVDTWLFVSGQIPETPDGQVPASFDEQADLAWSNVRAQLLVADMDVGNLVKVTTYLSSRQFNGANRQARRRALGSHEPALTVIITGIFDERWLLEIEAMAAR